MNRRFVYDSGALLFREGEPADYVYLVIKGRVVLEKIMADAPLELGSITPGKVLGELALIGDQKRFCSARAAENTEVLRFKKSEVAQLIEQDTSTMDLFLQAMATRIQTLSVALKEIVT